MSTETLTLLAQDKVKPKWRGVSHVFAFAAAIGGLFFLAIAPAHGAQYWAGVVYGGSLVLLFGLSSLYHRPMWSLQARERLRRVDHSSIFALIAGTFTPLCVAESGNRFGLMGWVMWSAAAAGALFAVLWSHGPRLLRSSTYVIVGFAAAPVMWTLRERIGTARVALLFAGAFVYIVCAGMYARKWPKLRPDVFGYHELFHALIVVAAAVQYAVILDVQWDAAVR